MTETVKRSKYDILNEMNDKYDASYCEITCYDEAYEFYNNLCLLWELGKVKNRDLDMALFIIDNWSKYK